MSAFIPMSSIELTAADLAILDVWIDLSRFPPSAGEEWRWLAARLRRWAALRDRPVARPTVGKLVSRWGRRRGGGSYEVEDAPLVAEAIKAWCEGLVDSSRQAAALVADRARGNSRPAKIDRLRKKIVKTVKARGMWRACSQ